MPADMKIMISDAFLKMTKVKNIDKITVKDLVDACGISRQAFYYHFHDIIEVIEWQTKQRFEKMLALGLEAENPEDTIRVFFSFVADSSDMLKKLLRSQKREYIEDMLIKGIRSYFEEIIRHKASTQPLIYSDMKIAVDFFTYGIAGLLIEHCGDKHVDVDKLSKQVYQMLKNPPQLISAE